jgi:hypothetical protein
LLLPLASLPVDSTPLTRAQFFDAYGPYFLAVTGFFIVEATAGETLGAMLPPNHVDVLWTAAVAKLKVVLQEQLELCRQAGLLQQVKSFVVFINDTLREYGLDVATLVGVVHDMRSRYAQLARADAGAEFSAVLLEQGSPLTLRSAADLRDFGARFALLNPTGVFGKK